MMGFLLLIPFYLVRFSLMAALDREAIGRAAHFPPMQGGEKVAYYLYQLSTVALLLGILPARVRTAPPALFGTGLLLYLAGLALLAAAVRDFAAPAPGGMRRQGLYRLSRNPMYLAYLVFFAGCALLVRSPLLLAITAVFQLSAHWVILAEERWCIRQFGEDYVRYMAEVRRYL